MKCDVCGQDYDGTHDCPGVPTTISQEEAAPSVAGFAPLYYLRLAMNIVRWNQVAMRRASHDSKAGIYGAVLWFIVAIAIELFVLHPEIVRIEHVATPAVSRSTLVLIFAGGVISGVAAMAVVWFIQVGLCHLICKWFLRTTGTLKGVMRPLLLGSIVNALDVIPVVGDWAYGIAWTAVMILVFEEVDGIDRISALVICIAINVSSHLLVARIFSS
jgi:hypothetical protein